MVVDYKVRYFQTNCDAMCDNIIIVFVYKRNLFEITGLSYVREI